MALGAVSEIEKSVRLLDVKYVLCIKTCFPFLRGKKLSNANKKEELKSQIELMEKEILHLKGRKRAEARMEYLRLLKSYGKECGLEEPIYIRRC